jgi:hypothetical protein
MPPPHRPPLIMLLFVRDYSDLMQSFCKHRVDRPRSLFGVYHSTRLRRTFWRRGRDRPAPSSLPAGLRLALFGGDCTDILQSFRAQPSGLGGRALCVCCLVSIWELPPHRPPLGVFVSDYRTAASSFIFFYGPETAETRECESWKMCISSASRGTKQRRRLPPLPQL